MQVRSPQGRKEKEISNCGLAKALLREANQGQSYKYLAPLMSWNPLCPSFFEYPFLPFVKHRYYHQGSSCILSLSHCSSNCGCGTCPVLQLKEASGFSPMKFFSFFNFSGFCYFIWSIKNIIIIIYYMSVNKISQVARSHQNSWTPCDAQKLWQWVPCSWQTACTSDMTDYTNTS